MTLAGSMHSCPSRGDRWGGDIHDMHTVACAAERWHTPMTLAGSMHSCPSRDDRWGSHDAGGLNALLSVS
jgi:hypothetical protein